MEAIEIYTKIMELVKGQNYTDASTAIRFVQNKIDQDFYAASEAKRKSAYANQCASESQFGLAKAAAGSILGSNLEMADYIIGEGKEAA